MKRGNLIGILGICLLLIIPLASAGFFSDFLKDFRARITGEATDVANVDLNISITTGTAPIIYNVTGLEAITLTDGPGATYLVMNFSVNDSDGAENLDNTSAMLNITKAGEALRIDSSCAVKDFAGIYANYTCNVTMWWFDSDGVWTVYANISDLNTNYHVNDSNTRSVGALTGLTMDPSALTFSGSLLAGATNTTPSNYLTLNNTGNKAISDGNVKVNSTDLLGEGDPSKALWASNFSMSPLTGGDIECNVSASATAMVNWTETGVSGATLEANNFTYNNGTGQENMYLCLRQVGDELIEQQYSTAAFGAWEVKVVP